MGWEAGDGEGQASVCAVLAGEVFVRWEAAGVDGVALCGCVIVGRYKVEFAGSEDGARVEGGMKDQFTGAPGGLELCFKRREEREEGKMEVI